MTSQASRVWAGRVSVSALRLNFEFYDLHDMTRASQPGPIIDPRAMAECENASGWHIAHLARSPKGIFILGNLARFCYV